MCRGNSVLSEQEPIVEEMNRIYECALRIVGFQQLLNDVAGKLIPYNIIIKIKPLSKNLSFKTVNSAKELCLEMEKMGYPRKV